MENRIKGLFNYMKQSMYYEHNRALKRIYKLSGEEYIKMCNSCNGSGKIRFVKQCTRCHRSRGFHILWDRIKIHGYYRCKKCNGGGLSKCKDHSGFSYRCEICEGSGITDWLNNLIIKGN